jgi:hypothetical protein
MEAHRRALPTLKLHSPDTRPIPHLTAISRFEVTVAPDLLFSPAAEAGNLGTEWNCWLCGKAVSLEACKTDEYGKSVHEECYVARLALEKASAQWVAQHTLSKQEGAGAGL